MASEEGAAANNSKSNPVEIIDLTGDDDGADDDDDVVLFVGVKEAPLTGDAPPRAGAAPVVARKSIKTEAIKSIEMEKQKTVASSLAAKKVAASSTTTAATARDGLDDVAAAAKQIEGSRRTDDATVAATAATTRAKTEASDPMKNTAAGLAPSKPAATTTTTTSASTNKPMGATVAKTLPAAPGAPRNVADDAAELSPKQNDGQTNKSSLSSTVTSSRKESSNNVPPPASKASNAPPKQLVNQNPPSTAAAATTTTTTSKFSIFSALKDRLKLSSTAAASKKTPTELPASTPKIIASTNTKTKQPLTAQNPSMNSQDSSTASTATKQPPTVPNLSVNESTTQAASTASTATKQPPTVPNLSVKESTTQASSTASTATKQPPPTVPNAPAEEPSTEASSTANKTATNRPLPVPNPSAKYSTTKRTMKVGKKSSTRVSSTANTTSNASATPLDPNSAETLATIEEEVPQVIATVSGPRGATNDNAVNALLLVPSTAAHPVAPKVSLPKKTCKLSHSSSAVNSNKLPNASVPMHQHDRDSSLHNKSTSSTSISTSSTQRAGKHISQESLINSSVSGAQGQHGKRAVASETNKSTDSNMNDTAAPRNRSTVPILQPIPYAPRQIKVSKKSTKLKHSVQRLVSYDDSRPRIISNNTNAESGNDKAGDSGEDNSSGASTASTYANAPMGQMVVGRQNTYLPIPAPTAAQNQPKSSTSEHSQNRKRLRGCLRLADSDSSDDSDADSESAAKIPKTGKEAHKVANSALGTTSESIRNKSLRTAVAETFGRAATQNIVSSATSSPREDDPDDGEHTEEVSTCDDSGSQAVRTRTSSERNPPSALSVESDSKRVRLSDGDQESSQSTHTHVALTDYDSKTWIDGKGISKKRAASFLPRDFKRCGSCRACASERCGICGLCCFVPADACVLRCCTNSDNATKQKYHDEIQRMLTGRKNRGLVVGTRVRARRSADQNQWFWGSIVKKYKHSSGHNMFTIMFDDGSSKHMVPEKDMLDIYEDILSNEVKNLPPFEEPCSESPCACLQCTKQCCVHCVACRGEAPSFSSFLPDGTRCLQKMCLKKQAPHKAPGLAYGWTYGFGMPPSNPEIKSFQGLWLQSPAGLKFLSIERANGRFPKEVFDKTTFYDFVGLSDAVDLRYTSLDSAPSSKKANGDQESATFASCAGVPRTPACGTCYSCTKTACGACNVCRDPSSSKSACLQKMCLEHQEPRSAPGLAAGWKYVFGKLSKNNRSVDDFRGLRIVAPNGVHFLSIQRAISSKTAPVACAVFGAETFYEFVGLSGAVDQKYPYGVASRARKSGDGMGREYSDELNVGSRCYAKFTNGWYYWGEITAVKGNVGKLFFDVQFDDGDFLSGIERGLVETEKAAYQGSAPLPILPDSSQSLGLLDLHSQRCKACTLCKRDECGHCHACKINAESTQSERMACLMKMCAEIDKEKKSQHIPGLARIWKFYFSANEGSGRDIPSELTELTALHPDSLLHVFVGDIRFECLKEAMEAANYPRETVIRTVKQFYEEHLGIPLRRQEKHTLVGCGYYMEWIDARGQRREIYGTITECWESILEAERKLSFTVRYDERMILLANQMSSTKLRIPASRDISEELAWCGHVAWRKKEMDVHPVPKLVKIPFHLNWIVPGTRFKEFNEPLPSITMVVAGYELCLKAQPSGIKNAGLGLFVRITNRAGPSRPEPVFELPAGHLVDFGVYAPCTDEECKVEQVVVMKNFLLHYFAEGYCFDKETEIANDFDLFDVSQDHEQSLTKAASENLLVFANESDGKTEIPTLVCRYDPEGALHYLLGYDEEHLGPLQIPYDQEFELKIDYGKLYEKVRVRKGYARVTGAKKKDLIEACQHDDAETIDDIGRWTLRSVSECLRVLEKCLGDESFRPSTNDFFERALIFALGLRARVKSIEEEFRDVDLSQTEEYCDNGVSTMADNGTVQLSARIVKLASNRCSFNADGLKSKILCHKLLKGCVMKCLHLAEDALMRIDAGELCQLILSFPE